MVGIIKVSQNANVYAYNGNIYTDGTGDSDGSTQAYIYGQNKIVNKKITLGACHRHEYVSGHTSTIYPAETINESGYRNPTMTGNKTYQLSDEISLTFNMSLQGVGTGAGYNETSNGTYEDNLTNEDIKTYINSLSK